MSSTSNFSFYHQASSSNPTLADHCQRRRRRRRHRQHLTTHLCISQSNPNQWFHFLHFDHYSSFPSRPSANNGIKLESKKWTPSRNLSIFLRHYSLSLQSPWWSIFLSRWPSAFPLETQTQCALSF